MPAPEDRIAITNFVNGVFLPARTRWFGIPAVLRRLHALPPFPTSPFNTTCTFLQSRTRPRWISNSFKCQDSAGKLHRAILLAIANWPVVTGVSTRNPWPRHNDLFKPDNMLFDGNRLWLVDWEAAFQNDRYADLAVVANMLVANESEEKIYLQEYFGQAPDEYQRARFYLMKTACTYLLRHGVLTLRSSGNPIDPSEPGVPYRDFQRRFWTREVGSADDQAKSL